MSVKINPVDGALVHANGKLEPVAGADASAEGTYPPEDQPPAPIPLAMTGGRQFSAARREPVD